MKIDFVVPWVDGNDPEWRKQKNEYFLYFRCRYESRFWQSIQDDK